MRLKLDETIMILFLIGTLLVGFKILEDLNSIDIKGQVKSIVEYNHGVRK